MSVTLVSIRFGVFTVDIMPLRLPRVAKTSMPVLIFPLDRIPE